MDGIRDPGWRTSRNFPAIIESRDTFPRLRVLPGKKGAEMHASMGRHCTVRRLAAGGLGRVGWHAITQGCRKSCHNHDLRAARGTWLPSLLMRHGSIRVV